MTEQREFPFFVNGQFWSFKVVVKSDICRGHVLMPVITKSKYYITKDYDMPDIMATMKRVVFQLIECGEQQHNMIACWVQGFWVCDDELYIENGGLYLKG